MRRLDHNGGRHVATSHENWSIRGQGHLMVGHSSSAAKRQLKDKRTSFVPEQRRRLVGSSVQKVHLCHRQIESALEGPNTCHRRGPHDYGISSLGLTCVIRFLWACCSAAEDPMPTNCCHVMPGECATLAQLTRTKVYHTMRQSVTPSIITPSPWPIVVEP